MSKRKPALRIGGGVLNRNTLACNSKVTYTDKSIIKEDATRGEIESQLADFMREIDEVSTVQPDAHKQDRFGDWQKCLDEKTQHSYYWNTVTDAVSWVLPDGFSDVPVAVDSVEKDSESKTITYKRDEIEKPCITQTDMQLDANEENRHHPDTGTQAPTEACSDNIKKDQTRSEESSSNDGQSLSILPSEDLRTSSKAEVGTQCKLCSSMCINNDNASSSKLEVLQLRDTLTGKLNYLGVSNSSLMHLQILLIQIETRILDWKAKVLPTSYVLERLKEAHANLKAFEVNATPAGWTCHWDSTATRYYYVNNASGQKQWSYPEITVQTESGKDSETEEDKKNINSNDLPEQDGPNPPLPDTPLEKPPPPPPQPEDDGYDVDEDEESLKKGDDGIMMEISEDEKEESAEHGTKAPTLSVVSQQPIIYKGFEVISHSEHGVENEPSLQGQQGFSFTQYKDMTVKGKAKKSRASKKAGKPYKAMSSLVAQWQRAKEEINEEDRLLEESDEEEREETSRVKIAKWKQEQLISGKAVSNPNFEPVPTDWRTRLLGKKKKL